MEHFSKKYRHLKSIILHKFHCLLFVFFIFLVFFISFFLFYKSLVFKKFLKFLWFYCMDPIFYQKILQNYGFFFQKKLTYLKSRISTKFHHLLFLFLFFKHFWHFFSISPIQTCQKIREFFVVFYSKDWRFYQRILETSKSSYTKIQIFEIIFF